MSITDDEAMKEFQCYCILGIAKLLQLEINRTLCHRPDECIKRSIETYLNATAPKLSIKDKL